MHPLIAFFGPNQEDEDDLDDDLVGIGEENLDRMAQQCAEKVSLLVNSILSLIHLVAQHLSVAPATFTRHITAWTRLVLLPHVALVTNYLSPGGSRRGLHANSLQGSQSRALATV